MKIKRLKLWTIISSLLIAGGLFYYFFFSGNKATTEAKNASPDRLFTIKRGELVIGIRQVGFVNSQKSYKLGLEASVATKLLWIIAENSKVKKDDVLAKFETYDQTEKIDAIKLEIENISKELEIELEAMKILVSTNESNIKASIDKTVTSEDSLKKYKNFERTQKRDSLELDLQKNTKLHDDAMSEYLKKKSEIEAKGASNDEENKKNETALGTLKQKVDNAKNDLNKATTELKLFKRYANPSKLSELANQVQQSILEQNKVRISASSQLMQKEKAIMNLQSRLKKKQEQLAKEEESLRLMQIVSPVEGVVIYGNPDQRWGNQDIRLGMDIRRGQILMTIPDMSKLVVEFDLPEQYRSKVTVNDKVIITPESMKQLQFEGKLSKIDQLPVNQIFWDRNSPKIYKSEVSFQNSDSALVSGMSVQLEIITKEIKDVLFIPVEAVFEEGGKYFVYKKSLTHPKKQAVKIGQSNDNYVQITEGVAEGDVVFLYKPFQRKEDNS